MAEYLAKELAGTADGNTPHHPAIAVLVIPVPHQGKLALVIRLCEWFLF
jgi:hypothetical protein